MNDRHKFNYNKHRLRKNLIVLFICLPLIPIILIMFGIDESIMGSVAAFMSFFFFFIGIYFIIPLITNKQGFAVLHEEYVEINLNGIIHQLRYDDIGEIWHHYHGGSFGFGERNTWYISLVCSPQKPHLVIAQSIGIFKKHRRPLADFMTALEQKVIALAH